MILIGDKWIFMSRYGWDDEICESKLSSGSAEDLTPLLDRVGSATDVSPATGVVSPAIAVADVAALGIDGGQVFGLAAPPGVDAGCIMDSSTGDSAPVAPPAVTAQELAHSTY
jgi:hypothetical protein